MPLIAVDIRANHDTGIARYGRSLIGRAAQVAPEQGMKLLLVVRDGDEARYAPIEDAGHEIVGIRGDRGFVRDSAQLRDLLVEHDVDLFYTSHYLVDRKCPVPFVPTLHDLNRWRFPELSYDDDAFAARFGRAELDKVAAELNDLSGYDESDSADGIFTRYFKAANREIAARARRINVVSHATADDVTKILAVDPSRLSLVRCGVDRSVFGPASGETVREVQHRYGVARRPYVMFVGLTHGNKRYPWLVDQLTSARDRLPTDACLLAVGGHAEHDANANRVIAERGAESLVVFTGRVPDHELAALYTGAAAWVTASANEGYNLPPVEALACGTEVIATDIAALRENLRSHAHFYAPDDGERLISLVAQALSGELPALGTGFVFPSWEEAADNLVASWRLAITASS